VVSESKPTRASGLLLHVTSLPSRYGIGDLGPNAHRFVTRIAAAGQRYWQMLPIGPTGYDNSPYSATSAFAGNPLLVSPDLLFEAGLIDEDDRESMAVPDEGRVDYGAIFRSKQELLAEAAARFPSRADQSRHQRYAEFKDRQGPLWLDEFCLFLALKEAHGLRGWIEWEPDLAKRRPTALSDSRRALASEIETNRVVQFLFFEQWDELRRTAREHGVELVGDLPLYVAHDSADVWSNPDLFRLDEDGKPEVIAGVPPDYFSVTGQRWGNPIFNWEEMASRDFHWWKARVRHALTLFDMLRIDHFRGIAGYWEIPAGETTAVNGRWQPGPASKLLGALSADFAVAHHRAAPGEADPAWTHHSAGSPTQGSLRGVPPGPLPFIAEDLGLITDDVIALRRRFGLPGMRVAQFGFDRTPDQTLHHPDRYTTDVWAYTGTHDNNTTVGWFWEGNPRRRSWRLKPGRRGLYRRVGGDIPWGLMEMVSRSRAMTSIFPVQDILGLGAESRINTPGTSSGNWEWRLRSGQLTDTALGRLHDLTEETRRG
jgi:4-alpha-glucanotransferase